MFSGILAGRTSLSYWCRCLAGLGRSLVNLVARTWDAARKLRISLAKRKGALRLKLAKATGRVASGPKVVIRGVPILDVRAGATLAIGSRTQINSFNLGYHINMASPVKLMADRRGASITIGSDCRIHGSCIHAQESVTIGDRVLIAAGCQIMDGNGHDTSFDMPELRIKSKGSPQPVIIEEDVWLAAGVIVLPGAHIGRGSIIAAYSVVRGEIPAMSLAGGSPCKVIKRYEFRSG